MKKRILFVACIMILLAACGKAASNPASTPTAQTGILYVDPGQDLGPISPYIYGTNYGPENAVPANMVQAAFDSHITVLRFPDGRWGSTNDIFPTQIDTLVALCKKIGAIPTISVRFQNGTPEAAAALVHYTNIEQGYHITYWSIGNEPDYETLDNKKIDVAYFNEHWREIAVAMKAVDPTIKLLGPELSQWGVDIKNTPKYPPTQTPTGLERKDWMTEFLKANGDLVDIVAVHRYPFYALNDKNPVTIARMQQNTLDWDTYVQYLRSMVKQYTGRDLPVAFTEINSDSGAVREGETTPDSFYNAIWYADVLGHLISQHVFMVNQFELATRQGGFGLIFNDQIRPTYYVFQMYSHFGNELVYARSGFGYVDVYAAKKPDGSLTVMVVNLTDYEKHLPLQIKGMKPAEAQVWLFDAKHNAADLGVQTLRSDGRVDLPAESITLYSFEK